MAGIMNVADFDELNEEQKDYVVQNIEHMGNLYEDLWYRFNEEMTDVYTSDVYALAKEYENEYGLSIKCDRLYWQSNSQGPYPEWDFDSVFREIAIDTDNGGTVYVEFYGGSLEVDTFITVEWVNADGYYEKEDGLDIGDLHNLDYNLTDSDIEKVETVIDKAQEFIDEVWKMVDDVCTSYPDYDWLYDTMEYNEMGAFEIISDTEVRYIG